MQQAWIWVEPLMPALSWLLDRCSTDARLPPKQQLIASFRRATMCSFELQPVIPPDEYEAFTTLRSDLPLAIAALHRLTRLTALSLSAGAALTDIPAGEDLDDWYSWEAANARLPPLAGLSALTELRLSLFVPPPPDWQHLTSLCCLELRKAVDWEEKPLTSLCSLTHLGFHSKHHPEPSCLASLPRLATVHAPFASAEWHERLSALLPHVELIGNV